MDQPWHAYREDVLAVMRQVDDAVQHAWGRSRDLSPRHGFVSVGSADFDCTLKATIGEQYLRVLRTGGDTEAAFQSAMEAGQEAIDKWNASGCVSRVTATGRFELHRNKCAAESIAIGFHARFVAFREPPKSTTTVTVAPEPQSRVRFAPAIIDGGRYCGPVCLSALTGLGTKQLASLVRRQFRVQAVRGMSLAQMRWVIESAGYQVAVATHARTIEETGKSSQQVLLINLPDHWLLLRGSQIVCTESAGRIGNVKDSKYRRDPIVAAYEIQGELSESAFKRLLSLGKSAKADKPQLVLF